MFRARALLASLSHSTDEMGETTSATTSAGTYLSNTVSSSPASLVYTGNVRTERPLSVRRGASPRARRVRLPPAPVAAPPAAAAVDGVLEPLALGEAEVECRFRYMSFRR